MALTDSFGGAESSVDAQKKALLAAVAQHGAAGKAAYEAQAAQADEFRKAAVKSASDRAGTMGAPVDLVKQLHGTSDALAARYEADGAAASQAYGNEQARQVSSNASYMDQLRAAIPLSRQVSNARKQEAEAQRLAAIDDQNRQRADQDRQRQWAQEDRAASLADRQQQRGWSLADRAYEESQRKGKEMTVLVNPVNPASAGKSVGLSKSDISSITKYEDWPKLVNGFSTLIGQGKPQAEVMANFRQWEALRGHAYPKTEALLSSMFYPASVNASAPATRHGASGSW